jgi:O-antigen biosynthesis alpha-1,4-mannosyltransferase
MSSIVVNLSRIGKKGTGLYVFSKNLVACFRCHLNDVSVVAPVGVDFNGCDGIIRVPSWVSMTQKVSRIRPILWLVYAIFLFPERAGRILSTTHHAVPGAKRQIITIHDLRPYFYPDSFPQRFYFRRMLPRVVRKVDGILTVSDATKRLIIQCYGIAPGKIHVVPNCVDVSRFSARLAGPEQDSPYLFVVGATWAHKNAHELLQMASLWAGKYRLKIISGQGSYRDSLRRVASEAGILERIDFIEYVAEGELIALYQGATALVYPSLMEGFGIPPIEAMACGVPVIVSDIEVFRETYGAVPIYVELGKPASWESAFMQLEDATLVGDMVRLGLERARSFSIDRVCSSLMKALAAIWPDLTFKP